ncbi:MAG: PocR ligand-binding domain-containing protein [Nitrospinae bacterium]|nr:PocR ligand-binding domain-containing protein [Nitrospinota bacterium]
MDYTFTEIFDIPVLTRLCESFTKINGTVTALLDLEGNVHIATGWQDICTKFHRIHPKTSRRCTESDTILAVQLEKGLKYNIYNCENGLVDIAVPVYVNGKHLGNFFTGQFFFEKPNIKLFKEQARQFNFDEDAYLDALSRVPTFDEESIKKTMNFLVELAQLIGEMGMDNLNKLRAEEERRHKAEDQITRLGRTIESSLNEIYMFEAESFNFILVNKGARENLGYTMEELKKLTLPDIKPEFTKEKFKELTKPLLDKKKDLLRFQTILKRKNGSTYDVEVNIQLMSTENPPLYLAIIQDITERKIAEKKLEGLNLFLETKVKEETNKRLQKEQLLFQQSKMAAMGEMVAAIAHQWRQPLNLLGLSIQNLEDTYEYGELTQESLSQTVSELMNTIQFMSSTIDDFRNFFKPTNEKVSFILDDLIQQSIKLTKAQLGVHFIELFYVNKVNFDKSIIGYPNELKQVLLNLISNAKDAIIAKGSNFKGVINVTNFIEDSKHIVTIEDNGGGIDENILDRIFEPFFTTKLNQEGTGIGLYMSKMIIEEHMYGKLNVANSTNGAMFTIVLNNN